LTGVGHIAGDPQSAITLIARLDGGFSRLSVRTAYSYVPLAWFTSEHAGVGHIAVLSATSPRYRGTVFWFALRFLNEAHFAIVSSLRTRLTDVGRLGDLLDRAADTMLRVDLERVSPLAVPLLVMIGRESVAQGSVDDALLMEAESLAGIAMTP
jgi:hypothetical protein